MTKGSKELKSCPFCKSAAETNSCWLINCSNINCKNKPDMTPDQWNTRASNSYDKLVALLTEVTNFKMKCDIDQLSGGDRWLQDLILRIEATLSEEGKV